MEDRTSAIRLAIARDQCIAWAGRSHERWLFWHWVELSCTLNDPSLMLGVLA